MRPTGATEYCPAAQLVQVTFEEVEKTLWLVPAGHVESAVQEVALAADQLAPTVQLAHTVLAVAVQVEFKKVPAEQPVLKEHSEQGA